MSEPTIWEKLSREFLPEEIEWRIQSAGVKDGGVPWVMLVPYIDGRAVMNRLDVVVGHENWEDRYRSVNALDIPGMICRLSIRNPETGEWIHKEDGADARSQKAGEPMRFKGLMSDALKRTAVKFGVGRELYDMNPVYVEGSDIKSGYPRNNGIRLYVKGKVNGWCERPNVNKPAQKSRKTSTQKSAGKKEGDLAGDATENQITAIKRMKDGIDYTDCSELKNRIDDFLDNPHKSATIAGKLIMDMNEAPRASKTESIKNRLKRANV